MSESKRFSGAWRRLALDLQVICVVVAVIGLSMGGLGYWLNSYVRHAEINNAANDSVFYMNVLLKPLLSDIEHAGRVPEDVERQLDAMLENDFAVRPIVAAMLWWRDTTVAYSTDKKLMGQKVDSQQLATAFTGEVVIALQRDLSEHGEVRQERAGQTLMEIYIPLRDQDTDEVTAVVEFYQNAAALQEQLNRASLVIWSTVGLTTALMLVLILSTVAKARSVVDAHRKQLNLQLAASQELAAQNLHLRLSAEGARMDAFRMNEDLLNQLGSDIHDGPLQLLSLIILRLKSGAKGGGAAAREAARQSAMLELVRQTMQDLRNLAEGLAIPELEALSVEEALQLAVSRHQNQTGTAVAVHFGSLPQQVSSPLKICLYRVVQEALSNAFWHAGGVGQEISASATPDEITLEVRDKGEDAPDARKRPKSGLGLPGLARRVRALQGCFEVIANDDGGTVVKVKLPL